MRQKRLTPHLDGLLQGVSLPCTVLLGMRLAHSRLGALVELLGCQVIVGILHAASMLEMDWHAFEALFCPSSMALRRRGTHVVHSLRCGRACWRGAGEEAARCLAHCSVPSHLPFIAAPLLYHTFV